MDSLSQLNRHHQKEVNYGKGLTQRKKNSNVGLISLCYGNGFILLLGEIGLPLLTSGLDCASDISENVKCFCSFALFTPQASHDEKRTWSPAGAAAVLQSALNTLKRKTHISKLKKKMFFSLYMKQSNV